RALHYTLVKHYYPFCIPFLLMDMLETHYIRLHRLLASVSDALRTYPGADLCSYLSQIFVGFPTLFDVELNRSNVTRVRRFIVVEFSITLRHSLPRPYFTAKI